MVILVGAIFRSLLILIADRKIGYTVAHVATDLRLTLRVPCSQPAGGTSWPAGWQSGQRCRYRGHARLNRLSACRDGHRHGHSGHCLFHRRHAGLVANNLALHECCLRNFVYALQHGGQIKACWQETDPTSCSPCLPGFPIACIP